MFPFFCLVKLGIVSFIFKGLTAQLVSHDVDLRLGLPLETIPGAIVEGVIAPGGWVLIEEPEWAEMFLVPCTEA